ncbi:MAG: restriction endonuclease, partial [Polyangiaceae bacterium]
MEPAPDLLPLADPAFDWRRFERFCRAIVSKLPRVITCTHYGRPGNKQRGIDLVATMTDGGERTYQCRQWRRFSASHVRKTIRETSYTAAQHIILTSAEADASARDEIAMHAPKWELWDITDISQKVRELAPQDAHDIVTVCFSAAWCRAFLRMGPLAALLSSEASLAPYLDAKRAFNHAHALVGRDPILRRLVDFAGSPMERVAIVAGAGGTGKTRLLLELDRRLRQAMPQLQVRRAEEGIPITEDV